MDKQLNLKDVQKEISLITNALKAGTGRSGDFLTKSEKAKKRLLEIEKVLQGYLGVGYHNLSDLESVSSGKLQDARQIAGGQIDKIKKLLSDVNSDLDYCRHIKKKTASPVKTTETGDYKEIEKDTDPMSTSEVTSQTIALLDAQRYGATTGHETIIKYPKPDLGLPTNQRNCGIADKIRMGLRGSGASGHDHHQITMPKFYHIFCRGKV